MKCNFRQVQGRNLTDLDIARGLNVAVITPATW